MCSLDDFFAKKDRKKSTTKTNLLAADELYRTLEETAKAPQEVDSTEKLQVEGTNNQHQLEFGIRFSDETIDEEDEWCDFTEEHDQPFPNLKRNSKLILSATAAAANEDANLTDENCPYQDTGGDGLGVGSAQDELGKPACPWLKLEPTELTSFSSPAKEGALEREPALNASQSQSPLLPRSQLKSQSQSQVQNQSPLQSQSQSQSQLQSPSESQSQSQTTLKTQPNNVVKKQVYVPPALRQSQSEFSVRPRKQANSVSMKLAKGQAPDINNVDFFPSLCQSRSSKRAK
ncbi:PREDICTED: uncharacterized protein DDB_G0292186 [Drosophila arizonae]|uniref:Uncharacterized protein DDB_G0292186 n=1 Tax=Drosophila arizonae TaxID=7263 RepID=A0ABM1PZQ1_DROAR|nr:PREDICTED: uncharacterized protein DDB_G0292186 [Drosophila arizonae]